MTDLSPEARSLFDAERRVDGPSAAEQNRLRQAVIRRVGVGAFMVGSATTAASTVTTGAAAAAGLKTSVVVATMVGVGALTAGAVTAAVTFFHPASRPAMQAPAPRVAAPQELSQKDSSPKRTDVSILPHTDPASEGSDGALGVQDSHAAVARSVNEVTAEGDRRPAPRSRELAAQACTVGASAKKRAGFERDEPQSPIGKETPENVGVQVELLRRSQEALRLGRPDVALARLEEHQARFPTSSLLQERQAGRVLALCALGRAEQARSEAAAFVRRFPGSPLEGRVLGACASGVPSARHEE